MPFFRMQKKGPGCATHGGNGPRNQVTSSSSTVRRASSLHRHLALLALLVDQRLVDVRDHTTTGNGGLQRQKGEEAKYA